MPTFCRWFLIKTQVIKTAVARIGTDKKSLSRAILSRAEIDLMKIRREYLNIYAVSLDDDVISDTSGDYKNFLLTLLGAKI
ncbi:hypothetical protein MLD38_024067 [Melastoma candidum]|uniref:Uncharacterized protein n=1 Tax=Melastoma candidum TaxID=119954 RepID=A0ACB9NR96_9MYRT|nr:hypothetical protein MLD38_024067 [Melastoma candidum]